MTGAFGQRADLRGLKHFIRKYPDLMKKALERPALQMLTWMNTGSPRESATPPIRTGVLRGSGSAFVGGKLVGSTPAKAGGTPARSSEARDLDVHWVFNTEYAAKMHEWDGGWGKFTQQSIDGGNKWMEKHVIADRDAFTKLVARDFQKQLAKLGPRI